MVTNQSDSFCYMAPHPALINWSVLVISHTYGLGQGSSREENRFACDLACCHSMSVAMEMQHEHHWNCQQGCCHFSVD